MHNTILLIHGCCEISERGDAIWGDDNNSKEVKRWSIEQEAEAIEALKQHHCRYLRQRAFVGSVISAEEWALEYCECDENGEFIDGSDYVLAEEEAAYTFAESIHAD